MTSKDLCSAISSPVLADGHSPCVSADGPTTDLFGQALAPVNPSRSPARNEVSTTSGTCGPPWVSALPMMQQTVLLTAVRGPDGVPKYHRVKFLIRWFRRCILLSAMDGQVLETPIMPGGGSFTGPSLPLIEDRENDLPARPWPERMQALVSDYLCHVDELPHHFQLHFMHAAEILGYKHPDPKVRAFWAATYIRLVRDMHLQPEAEADLDERLGDSVLGWRKHADPATVD